MKPKVFVIMPFEDDIKALYDSMKDRYKDKYEFTYAGDMDNQQNILKDIVLGISSANIIIADLTDNNPNVFYELGLAHAMNKKVIIITQELDELPFDIRSYRVSQYSLMFNKLPLFFEELDKNLAGALDGSVGFGNPVYDFLPNYKFMDSGTIALLSSESDHVGMNSVDSNANNNETDAGLLDNIEVIQQNSICVLNEINGIGDEVTILTNSLEHASMEINRVKGNGGNIDLSFVKKVCRNLSQPINEFSSNLQGHVNVIQEKWSGLENNYLLMLDNINISITANHEGIRQSTESLKTMKESIPAAEMQIEETILCIKYFQGYERSLNKAANSMVLSLENYLQMLRTMSSSIERIINRSSLLLGD